jgi:hypothetical protein
MTAEAGFLANECGHPEYGGYIAGQYHIGADFDGSANQAVYALGSGTVRKTGGFGAGNGYVLFIEHVAVDGTHFVAMYGHINSSSLAVGDTVTVGQNIATLYPNTPNGPHLHLGLLPGTTIPTSNWGNLPCSNWPGTNGFTDPMPYLGAHPMGGGTLTAVQPISVGPSSSVTMYTPLQWSYRVKNTSGGAASIQRLVVAIRGPAGDNLDIGCANGSGVTIQASEEWTCSVQLSQGFGSTGQFRFWADWQDYGGNWHYGQLGSELTLNVGPAATLTTTGALSIGPSDHVHMYQGVWWSYRVKNTSGSYTSIQRLIVAVRTPGNGAMDVICDSGTGVTLAPNAEWTCAASNSSGYGSTGQFRFWADWLGYDGVWHTGALSGTLTLYVVA